MPPTEAEAEVSAPAAPAAAAATGRLLLFSELWGDDSVSDIEVHVFTSVSGPAAAATPPGRPSAAPSDVTVSASAAASPAGSSSRGTQFQGSTAPTVGDPAGSSGRGSDEMQAAAAAADAAAPAEAASTYGQAGTRDGETTQASAGEAWHTPDPSSSDDESHRGRTQRHGRSGSPDEPSASADRPDGTARKLHLSPAPSLEAPAPAPTPAAIHRVSRFPIAAQSLYFKNRLQRWCSTEASTPGRPAVVLHVEPEEVAAVEEVLRFCYGFPLRSTEFMDLLRVLRVADMLQASTCVAASGQALTALQPGCLTLAAVNHVYRMAPGLRDSDAFAAALRLCNQFLLQLFGDVVEVLTTPSLRQQLQQLCNAALLALLRSDDLATDSEDSVLVLLAHWMEWEEEEEEEEEPSGGPATEPDDDMLERLCEAVRVGRLSPMFMTGILPRFHWFKPELTAEQLAEAVDFQRSSDAVQQLLVKEGVLWGPAGWYLGLRKLRPCALQGNLACPVELVIPQARLAEMLAAVEKQLPRDSNYFMPSFSPDSAVVFAHGLTFRLSCAFWFDGNGKWHLLLEVHRPRVVFNGRFASEIGFARACKLQVQAVLAPAVLLTAMQINPTAHQFVGTRTQRFSMYSPFNIVLGDHASLATWQPHMVDGALRVTASIAVSGS